ALTQRCTRCKDRHAMFAAQRSAFLAMRPGFTPPGSAVRRHWGWLLAAALLAAAAALAGLAAHA
ncbi:MAG TPA: hypothetical protein VJR89_14310, partial [Polyangiales bacterium]|nr:hypothetical protein [Polyangiales bacterium]